MGIVPAIEKSEPVKAHARKFFCKPTQGAVFRFFCLPRYRTERVRPAKRRFLGKNVRVRINIKFFERGKYISVNLAVAARLRIVAQRVQQNKKRRDVEFFVSAFRNEPVFVVFKQFFDIKSRTLLHFDVGDEPRRGHKARKPKRKTVIIAAVAAEPAGFFHLRQNAVKIAQKPVRLQAQVCRLPAAGGHLRRGIRRCDYSFGDHIFCSLYFGFGKTRNALSEILVKFFL